MSTQESQPRQPGGLRQPGGPRQRWWAGLVALGLALTGCAQLPSSGPVQAGRSDAPAAGIIQYDASRPVDGTAPREIVQGFIQAGAAGLSGDSDFEVARSFLTPEASQGWQPLEHVLVLANDEPPVFQVALPDTGAPGTTDEQDTESEATESGDAAPGDGDAGSADGADAGTQDDPADPDGLADPTNPSATNGTGAPTTEDLAAAAVVEVSVSVVAVADVDENGVYTGVPERTASEVVFTLTRVGEEWRIGDLPSGLLLTEGAFGTVFRPVPLAFLTPDLTTFVPDVRYVPNRDAATSAVEHLLAGPAQWLAPGVLTRIPLGVEVDGTRGVEIDDVTGVASVYLADSGVPAVARNLVYAQLRETLLSLSGVREVDLWIGAVPYEPGAGAVLPTQAAGVGGTMIAVASDGLVTVSGSEVVPFGRPAGDGGGEAEQAGDGGGEAEQAGDGGGEAEQAGDGGGEAEAEQAGDGGGEVEQTGEGDGEQSEAQALTANVAQTERVTLPAAVVAAASGTATAPAATASPQPTATAPAPPGPDVPTATASPPPISADPDALRSPALSYDGSWAAVLEGDQLLRVSSAGERVELATGADLLAPSIDRHGWVWTGHADGLLAVKEGEEPVLIAAEHLGDLSAVRVSREGARLVTQSRLEGVVTVQAAVIVRDDSGRPMRVEAGPEVARLATGLGVVWADATTVAVLGNLESQSMVTVRSGVVGGPTTPISSAPVAVSIAAGDGLSQLFIATAEDRLLARVSQRWEEVTQGVAWPAFPG